MKKVFIFAAQTGSQLLVAACQSSRFMRPSAILAAFTCRQPFVQDGLGSFSLDSSAVVPECLHACTSASISDRDIIAHLAKGE